MKTQFPEIQIFECDVTKDASRRALLAWATKEFSKVNVLVNNAGIQRDIT